ncbi:hypothetical protein K6V90_13430 [Cupriavidus pauculus]|uniref:hypothetical protein n=1 Tax=Cupriavidus pauculus TaxID=82633 RepID=UPI001C9359A3|nr:hypothetical protein [Cupriavidus pauculus]MBY4731533.1 hypothetical protein [Cupriavidus pauculus]
MTAIALLNPESSPHVVADSLLSAAGRDLRQKKTVWLPALGSIRSEWGSEAEPWHITRLGRKSFFLPNFSGVLVFAGDCRAAFNFWEELSDAIANVALYDNSVRVRRSLVDRVLTHTAGAADISLLGILIDENGQREAYVHNATRLDTANFGSCYVAGTGASLVAQLIRSTDTRISSDGGWAATIRISATENLAEQISSDMLYRESDARNGLSATTPIGAQCGGFCEWYGIETFGIQPMQPRIDIHLKIEDHRVFATRVHLSEMFQLINPPNSTLPSQRYSISVLNLGLIPYDLSSDVDEYGGWTFTPDDVHGVIIEPTFKLYEQPGDASGTSRLSGSLTPEDLMGLFSEPMNIHRVRLTVQKGGSAKGKGMYTDAGEIPNVRICCEDGHLSLQLSGKLKQTVLAIGRSL